MPLLTAAIIGLGRIGSVLDDPWFDEHVHDESWRARPCTHAGQLSVHPRIRLIAGADVDEDRRRAFLRRWSISSVYEDYREMVQRENPDIVVVSTRAAERFEVALFLAGAGVQGVILEKHLASSLHQADELAIAFKNARMPVVVNYPFRMEPSIRRLRCLVAKGLIGQLKTIVCHFPGRLLHSGTHFFDLCRFFGGDAATVFGSLEGDIRDDGEGSGWIQLKSGIIVLFDGRAKAAPAYLELLGTTGVVRIGNGFDVNIQYLRLENQSSPMDLVYQPPLVEESLEEVGSDLDRIGNIRRGRNVTPFLLEELLQCMEQGRPSISSIENALAAQEIAVGVYESHYRGSPEHIPVINRHRRIMAV